VADHEIAADVTGTVWKIVKQAGEPVAEGEAIMILESMKMEIPIEAPVAGSLAELRVAEGDPVAEGDVVCVVSA
jgi:acetyl-CoA carboxylase biotin carboxyl carrier protein